MVQDTISIFVVDDDKMYSTALAHFISLNPDHRVRVFQSAAAMLQALHEKPDIITLDYQLQETTGDKLLTQVKEQSPGTNVIIISGQQEINVVTELFKKGAHDYIVKDNDTNDRLWMCISNLSEKISLKKELEFLQQEVQKKYDFQKAIIGNSPQMKQVYTLMEKTAGNNINVSITGETGTGKDLIAKSIHFNSERRKFPFVPVNVAAIPKDLLESELFGHEKGSFTGAVNRRIGKFEEANKGTLFLDEIAEMDINLQAKLLRVLQEKELNRVGSNDLIKINVRIITATHRNMLEEVRKGKFREDLYYRLLGLNIHLPPLRDRGSDLLLIGNHFIRAFCDENNLGNKTLNTTAKQKLLMHSFPGNIRELKSVTELACVMSNGEIITELDIELPNTKTQPGLLSQDNLTLKQFTQKIVQHYLDTNNSDVLKVARLLDIGKSTLYRMVQANEVALNNKKPESYE